ncbi:c-type cytochrome biogenesis protein CcsB [Nakamurella silvestris]|nr:c-type cytochrome biogenesis protein CcsB [Nakamurella silvestris]
MAVNETFASLSDSGFQAALAGYVVALGCYAVEFASKRTTTVHTAERVPVGVGALTADGTPGGRPVVPTAGGNGIGLVTKEQRGLPWAERFGRAGFVVTVIALVANIFSMLMRGLATERMPLGNLYEFMSMICTVGTAALVVVIVRTNARTIGMFVMLPIALLAILSGTVLYVPAGELMASLNNYWLVIHVTAISISSGVLLFSGIASVLYLIRERGDRQGKVFQETSVWAKLPTTDALDRIAYRTAIIAFPVYTFAVVAGALWAEVAWGRYWGWDPKEIGAFMTWVVYACYLHARATAGWRGRRAAWISMLGFATVIFNLFFVNFVTTGLHSYA